jgi:hypothetical protein
MSALKTMRGSMTHSRKPFPLAIPYRTFIAIRHECITTIRVAIDPHADGFAS